MDLIRQNYPIKYLTTWIGQNPKSQRDFKIEIEKSKKGNYMSWDDSHRGSGVEIGDYFVFIDAMSKEDRPVMYFHEIIEIKDPSYRPSHWSSNGYTQDFYDTSKRYKLILDPVCSKVLNWDDYYPLVGYKGSHIQCTQLLRYNPILEIV